MRRMLAISTVMALLLAVLAGVAWAAPGGEKGKPDKPTTTVLEACEFGTDGVLADWDGERFGHRCLFLEDTPADYVFQIELGDGASIMRPYLAGLTTTPQETVSASANMCTEGSRTGRSPRTLTAGRLRGYCR